MRSIIIRGFSEKSWHHRNPPGGFDLREDIDQLVSELSLSAAAIMTLALPKEGFRVPGVEGRVGELYLADIRVPLEIYAGSGLGLDAGPFFAHEEIIRLSQSPL